MPDPYTRRARLMPAALAAAPAIVLLGSGLWSPTGAESDIAIVLGAVGLIICGAVRAAGRKLEPELWDSWGGAPTTRALRWRGSSNEPATERLHDRVATALDRAIPTRAEEDADPADADLRYEEAVAALRDLTRSRDRFPLVADEIAEYGFRRNCLGLRPLAQCIAAAVVLVCLGLLISGDASHPSRFVIALVAGVIALVGWTFGVGREWVRSSADLYARRLFEATETLGRERT